jgi:HSP20 family molecular chaperone IbpA
MSLPRLWTRSQELTPDAFRAMRREMANALRALDQNSSSPDIGAGAPAISVAETNDALEVTAELPGVDEKDIKVSLDDNQLIISGEERRRARKMKSTGMSRSGATAHSTDRCSCLSSRRTEPSTLISTRVCCISRSRSPLRP